jgi:hypothetical protein
MITSKINLTTNEQLTISLRAVPYNVGLRSNSYELETEESLCNSTPLKIHLQSSRMKAIRNAPMMKYLILQ